MALGSYAFGVLMTIISIAAIFTAIKIVNRMYSCEIDQPAKETIVEDLTE